MCATLPTLPQASTSILRKRSTYYNTSHERSAKSGGSKNTPIRLQRIDPDASLFETVAEPRRSQNSGSSRENILDHKKLDIKKTTEVRVTQERRRADGDQEGDQYFPRQNPFRSKRVDARFRGST
jgi:hypothetical protein